MKRIGDRRAHVRLEVVGVLWGTLELMKPARVININDSGGALIASPVPIPPETVHAIQMTVDGHEIAVDARVCHLQSVASLPEPEYRIGVEFLSVPVVRG